MTTVDRRPLMQVVGDAAGLARLGTEWDELLIDSAAGSVFLTHAWVTAWATVFDADHELRVWTARDPDSGLLLGIAPFVVDTTSVGPVRLRRLAMAGSGPAASDHLDLIVRHGYPHVSGELVRSALTDGDWDMIELDGLRPGSDLAGAMLRRRNDRAQFGSKSTCPVLDLPETWDEYEAGLGKNLRQNLRRYRRKLDREAGGPVVERLVVAAEDVTETVETLAAYHQAVRNSQGDRGSFADPRMIEFHRRVALAFLASGRLRMHRLDVDGKMAAAISCFRFDDTVSFYTTGYDLGLSRYGPGRRIMATAIRAAIEEGAQRFDFLRGDEAYKEVWGARPAFDERIRMPVSFKGHAFSRARRVLGPVRRAFRTLRKR